MLDHMHALFPLNPEFKIHPLTIKKYSIERYLQNVYTLNEYC